jgi:hypothetical protein
LTCEFAGVFEGGAKDFFVSALSYELCGMRMERPARARAGILWEKGWKVGVGRGSSGSFALERRAQDYGKNKQRQEQTTARTNNDEEQATARANAGNLHCDLVEMPSRVSRKA